MGTVHRFPSERVRGALYTSERPEPADILILPVVRIEREASTGDAPAAPGFDDASSGNVNGTHGRRRRRAPRS
jgi:hypothetical protein